MPPLVDYHCHLDLYPNYTEVFRETATERIEVLSVTTTPRAWARNKELTANNGSIRVALGLHPQLVAEGHDEFGQFERLLSETRYVGEVGIDAGPQFFRTLDKQRSVFERVLRCCGEHGGKILSIHSVRASREVLLLVERWLPPDRGTAVLHWFGGSKSEIRRASELGCYFSVNLAMLKNDARLEVLRAIPLNRMLTETDGPFTATDERASKPSDVIRTVERLAATLGMPCWQLQEQIWGNLRALETRG